MAQEASFAFSSALRPASSSDEEEDCGAEESDRGRQAGPQKCGQAGGAPGRETPGARGLQKGTLAHNHNHHQHHRHHQNHHQQNHHHHPEKHHHNHAKPPQELLPALSAELKQAKKRAADAEAAVKALKPRLAAAITAGCRMGRLVGQSQMAQARAERQLAALHASLGRELDKALSQQGKARAALRAVEREMALVKKKNEAGGATRHDRPPTHQPNTTPAAQRTCPCKAMQKDSDILYEIRLARNDRRNASKPSNLFG